MNHTVLEILSCLAQSQASIQLDLLAFIQALVKLASHLALNLFNVEECKVVSGDEHWDFESDGAISYCTWFIQERRVVRRES